jgi:hypothetical protein
MESNVSFILPWWQELEHIVTNVKPHLGKRDHGNAILRAIDGDLALILVILEVGLLTMLDQLHNFVSRFFVVAAFALFTICFWWLGRILGSL